MSCFHPQVNQTPDSCQETRFKVINLEDGGLYRFRVMAVNAAGESDPANLKEPIRVQDRLGEATSADQRRRSQFVTWCRKCSNVAPLPGPQNPQS